jgi:hypothetical protein
MKKIKIMLISLALFAGVGGTIAFKAKFTQIYCISPVDSSWFCTDGTGALNPTKCSIEFAGTSDDNHQGAIGFYCYTELDEGEFCQEEPQCALQPTAFDED